MREMKQIKKVELHEYAPDSKMLRDEELYDICMSFDRKSKLNPNNYLFELKREILNLSRQSTSVHSAITHNTQSIKDKKIEEYNAIIDKINEENQKISDLFFKIKAEKDEREHRAEKDRDKQEKKEKAINRNDLIFTIVILVIIPLIVCVSN